MTARAILIGLAIALVTPAATTVRADIAAPADKVTAARDAFERGAKFAAEERWGDALAAFEESAALRPHATTTYNVGYCERALGRAVRARKHFALALAQDAASNGTELTVELRAASNKYLEQMKAQIATPRLLVPKDVTLTIDGRPIEVAEGGRLLAGTRDPGPGEKVPAGNLTIDIDAGAHEIVITAPDGRSKVAHEYFPPGSTKEVRIELPPPAPPPTTVILDGNRARRTWGYVIGGLGIVGMGVGTYFGLSARSTWNDAKERCPERTACSSEAADMSIDAQSRANISTIAFVAGGAALLGGTILVLTSAPTERPKVTSVGVGLGFISLTGSF